MIAVLGKPILQSDLAALATLAGNLGCPPNATPAYRWDAYDLGGTTAVRWATELSRLRADVLAQGIAAMSPFVAGVPVDPTAGVVSGPWLIPSGHPWFFAYGGGPMLAGNGFNSGFPNIGRAALDVKLWSRGVATPFRVLGSIHPFFDYELREEDDETGYPGGYEATGTAEWAYSRPVATAGFCVVRYYAADVTNTGAVGVTWTDCTAAPDIEVLWETITDLGGGHFSVEGEVKGSWGTCLNPEGNADIYDPETGFSGTSVKIAWQTVGGAGGVCTSNQNAWKFYFSATYGSGDYAATGAPAISEDAWYLSEETPALTVTSTVRKGGNMGPAYSDYTNICELSAEALPTTPDDPAETHWQAKLWPGVTMMRGGGLAAVFPGQDDPASGQTVATPHNASDGVWVQPATDAEVAMNDSTRAQPGTWSGFTSQVAVDYVQITRRKPYGTKPAVEVQIGCWQGGDEARHFVTLATVELPAGQTRQRVAVPLLPIFDNLSIGYTSADAVTVRLGNWKPIGYPTGLAQLTGSFAPDGTPAGVVNDLEAFCAAIAGA